MLCENFKQKHCLSCNLLDLSYPETILLKEKKLLSLFPEFDGEFKSSIACEKGATGSRNKAKLAVVKIKGEIEFGFYSHDKVFKKLENCPVHAPLLNEILVEIKPLLKEFNIVPYDIYEKKGELKYILSTYSESTQEILIRFVLRSKESFERMKKLSQKLQEKNSHVRVVTVNIQPEHKAILEGDEEIILTEKTSISHKFNNVILLQGARSFFQTNSYMAQKLYENLQNELKSRKVNSLLDLYCGVGAFSFFASKYVEQIVGIEISKEAIDFANQAKKINKLNSVEFHASDVKDFLKAHPETSFEAIIVNPPRRGLDLEITNQLLKLNPQTIFYSSCNALTMQRDIENLKSSYKLVSLQLFDMFAFVDHFETFAVLEKI